MLALLLYLSLWLSQSLFYRNYFRICSFELTEFVPLSHFREWSVRYCYCLREFSVFIYRSYIRISMLTVSTECFVWLMKLTSFRSSIIHMCFTFFASSFTIAPFFALAKKPCMELIVIIEKNWKIGRTNFHWILMKMEIGKLVESV